MLVYNIGFKTSTGKSDETQLDVTAYNHEDQEIVELINLILSLKDEMDIKEIEYIDFIEEVDYEEEDARLEEERNKEEE